MSALAEVAIGSGVIGLLLLVLIILAIVYLIRRV